MLNIFQLDKLELKKIAASSGKPAEAVFKKLEPCQTSLYISIVEVALQCTHMKYQQEIMLFFLPQMDFIFKHYCTAVIEKSTSTYETSNLHPTFLGKGISLFVRIRKETNMT